MAKESEYLTDINRLKDEAITDLDGLLAFSKELVASARFN